MLRTAVLHSLYIKRVKNAIHAFLATLLAIIAKLNSFEALLTTLHDFHVRHILSQSEEGGEAARLFMAEKWLEVNAEWGGIQREVICAGATYRMLGREFWSAERRDADVREGMKVIYHRNQEMWTAYSEVARLCANASLGV